MGESSVHVGRVRGVSHTNVFTYVNAKVMLADRCTVFTLSCCLIGSWISTTDDDRFTG